MTTPGLARREGHRGVVQSVKSFVMSAVVVLGLLGGSLQVVAQQSQVKPLYLEMRPEVCVLKVNGDAQQLAIFLHDSQGGFIDVTSSCSYRVSYSTSAVSVSSTGLVTLNDAALLNIAAGMPVVQARYEGLYAGCIVVVPYQGMAFGPFLWSPDGWTSASLNYDSWHPLTNYVTLTSRAESRRLKVYLATKKSEGPGPDGVTGALPTFHLLDLTIGGGNYLDRGSKRP